MRAEGDLYLDDGESLDSVATGQFSLLQFTADQVSQESHSQHIVTVYSGWCEGAGHP